MAEYYPPTEDINVFNSALFTNEPEPISQSEASLLYLSKVNSDTSTAPLTNFTGNVSFSILPQSSAVPSNLPDLVNKNYTDTTFQTIANMVNYLTTATASAIYQTISGMSNYLDITGNLTQSINGLKTFSDNLTIGVSASLTLLGDQLISNQIVARTLNGTKNIWSTMTSGDIHFGGLGTTLQIYPSTTFSVIPNCSVGATSGTQLVNYTTLTSQSYTTLPIIQANANAWTNTNTFNSFLPTSTQPPTNPTDLTTKQYTDNTFLTQANAILTYQPISLMVNYLTTASAASTYLTISNAASTYLTQANAALTYLTISTASSTYQTITGMTVYLTTANAASTYLTISNAASTYLSITNATSTYLSITNAASTYLTQANAALTYLTITNAASIYQTITNMTNYVSRTGSVSENISGLKTFENNVEVFNATTPSLILSTTGAANTRSIIRQNGTLNLSINSVNPASSIIFQVNNSAVATMNNSQLLLPASIFLTTNDIKSRLSTTAHTLLADITTGSLTISSATATNTINGATTFNQTSTFSVIPVCSINPSLNTHLVNKLWIDTYFLTIANAASTYLTQANAATTYLTQANATSTYLSITNAASTYLTQTNAASTYLTITNAASTYLTTALASTTYQPISLMTNYLTTANAALTYLTQTNAASTYLTITNAASTYLTTALASTTYQPISLMTNYLTTANAASTYLTITNAASTYLTITNAASTYLTTSLASTTYQPISLMTNYLTTSNAASTYLTITTAASTYLTQALAATTYLTQANATSTYLSITNAASTYLTQALASTTYLTISNATSTYLSITNAASTYLTQANATSTYLSITNASSTYLTQANAITNYARLGSANTFTNTNTFNTTTNLNGQLNLKNNFVLYDLTSPNTKNVRIYQTGNDIYFTPDSLVGGANTNYYFSTLNSGGTNVNILKLTSSDATINGNAVITGTANISGTSTLGATNINGNAIITGTANISGTSTLGATNISGITNISGATTISNALTLSNDTTYSAATINLNSSTSSHSVNLFSAITSGTINIFSSLANSAVNMFSSSSNDTTLNINAKVKFRQVKLYNQVKTLTGEPPFTLNFPLEENILIRTSTYAGLSINLPAITANALGLTFNFIKTSLTRTVSFTASGTDTIIRNGSITGTTTDAFLLDFGQTSVQLTCLEFASGIYNWVVVNSSLPQQMSNPIGSIIQMANTMGASPTSLDGYLECDGTLYSYTVNTKYRPLYDVIGGLYGLDGTRFRVPNFNDGSFLRGFGGNSAAIGTQQADAIKNHTHSFTYNTTSRGSSSSATTTSIQTSGGANTVETTNHNLTSSTETRPMNYAIMYYIKY